MFYSNILLLNILARSCKENAVAIGDCSQKQNVVVF